MRDLLLFGGYFGGRGHRGDQKEQKNQNNGAYRFASHGQDRPDSGLLGLASFFGFVVFQALSKIVDFGFVNNVLFLIVHAVELAAHSFF